MKVRNGSGRRSTRRRSAVARSGHWIGTSGGRGRAPKGGAELEGGRGIVRKGVFRLRLRSFSLAWGAARIASR